jgi:hypothetical protein
MSVLSPFIPITDMRRVGWHVGFVPKADMHPSPTMLREKLIKIGALGNQVVGQFEVKAANCG